MRKKSEEAGGSKEGEGGREGAPTIGGSPGACGKEQRQRSSRWRQWEQMLASCCMEAARLWVARRAGHTQREGPGGGCVSLSCHPPERRARLDWS